MKKIILGLLIIGLSFCLEASSDQLKQLLKKVDELYRSSSSHSIVEMQVKTENWERIMTMEMWTSEMNKTFVRILSPKKDAGIATLKRGRDMWNYFPKINKIIKIPPSMMMGAWMGSDFTNDDMVKEASLIDDYNAEIISEDKAYYNIELRPKKETVTVWGKIILKIRKSDKIVEVQDFFNEKGKKVRTMLMEDVKEMGGKIIPTRIVLIPLNKKKQKTVVIYKEASFNNLVKQNVFTRKNLQKRR